MTRRRTANAAPAATSRAMPTASTGTSCVPAVEPPPVATPPVGMGVGGEVVGGEVVGGDVDVVGAAQVDCLKVSLSSVTEAFRANARPSTVTPVCTWMEVNARMLPVKVEFVPSVAELPTCQKTLQADASPSRLTLLLDAVMSVAAIWKMKTPLGSPWASSVSVPVIWNVPDSEL